MREIKKGQGRKQEAAGRQARRREPSSPFRRADIKLMQEDNNNQGWVITRLLTAVLNCSTNRSLYLIASLLLWESGVHKPKARDCRSFMTNEN